MCTCPPSQAERKAKSILTKELNTSQALVGLW